MANLTITVDAETLKRARIKAIQRGESVNRVLAEHLDAYAADDDEGLRWVADRDKWLAVAAKHRGRGSGGRGWTREDLYDETAAVGESA